MSERIERLNGYRAFWRLLPVGGLLMVTSLWGQLKVTQYSQPPQVVAEPVVVRLSGVTPQKITRPQGPFLLCVDNRLPGNDAHFSLSLNQGNSTELIGLDTIPSQTRASKLLDLQPGTYKLTVQNRAGNASGWTVIIQIN
jgi:hypothetical protein